MSDVEQDEIFEEGVAENETIAGIPEPEKVPIKKKTKKVTKIEDDKEPLLPEDGNPVVPPTKTKKKRVLTPEQKAKLLENLAKGRATSLAKRKKNAQLRKIKKEELNQEEDERIFQALKKKQRPKELETENARLKEELAALKLSMSAKKEKKVVPPQKLIQVTETPKIIENENKVVKPKPVEVAKPAKKEMSKREIQKLMRGL
tara:strand:- start:821 stop:1429 length:609 start_codon:yes stop_codon:yes gene_type:complete